MPSIPDVSNRTIGELVSLAGRHAVVTGGARGLGFGIARRLAEAGADVLIGDLTQELATQQRLIFSDPIARSCSVPTWT